MIVYEATAEKFIKDVDSNQIVSEIEKAFQEKLGRGIPPAEITAYANSLPHMERVVRRSGVPGDCGILIEYKIPLTNFRIDFVISGEDEFGNKNFVIVELKQWQKAQTAEGDGLVESFTGNAQRVVTHPSYQAMRYRDFISDFNEVIYSGTVKAYSCAYLHNYKNSNPEPLLDSRYTKVIESSPIYFRDDQTLLEDFVSKYVKKGKGMDILYEINNGKIRPSKSLIDHVASMFDGNQNYILLDEQKVAYETALNIAGQQEKSVVIINGGPGTGKSVLSVNLISALLKKELNAVFVAPNSSFRDAIVKKLTQNHPAQRIRNVFKGSSVFHDAKEDEFDVLVIDEAHRLKKKGAFMYKGVNQVYDVINASKVSIFFIDDNQAVRPEDIGSIQEIKNVASALDAKIFELKLEAQFRCAGAEGYINWLDDVFQMQETANFDGWDKKSFDFKIFDNPNELLETLKKKSLKSNSARVLAGYAWKWSSASQGNGNAEVNDVSIPEFNFSMPWNSRTVGTTWAIDDRGINQVGCIHTSQGLEFDYVGVIIGEDLSYNKETKTFETNIEKYKDATGKKGMKEKPAELNRLVRNIYKVLLTRGQKGCYVYVADENLREYLKLRLANALKSNITPKINQISPYQKEVTYIKVPLYDSVGCGELMHADTLSIEEVEVPSWLIKAGAKYFALRTKGDSMNLLDINDGDIILCQKNYQASSGSNAVVLIGDDATLKQIKIEKDGLVLIPKSTNPEHGVRKLTEDDEEFNVLGVFICKL
jgi:DUF2075 family protein